MAWFWIVSTPFSRYNLAEAYASQPYSILGFSRDVYNLSKVVLSAPQVLWERCFISPRTLEHLILSSFICGFHDKLLSNVTPRCLYDSTDFMFEPLRVRLALVLLQRCLWQIWSDDVFSGEKVKPVLWHHLWRVLIAVWSLRSIICGMPTRYSKLLGTLHYVFKQVGIYSTKF